MAHLIHSLGRYTSPSGAALQTLVSRLDVLLELDTELRKNGHVIYKDGCLLSAEVLPGLQLWELLYDGAGPIGRDRQRLLQIAVDRAASTTLTDLEGLGAVGELGPWAEDGTRSIDTIEKWIAVLREQLKIFRGDRRVFFEKFYKAFPDFIFSDRFPDCLGSFKGDLNDFVVEIVSALVSLAEDMPDCMKQPTTHECMKAFTAKSGYETSMEGNATRKGDLTFRFIAKDGKRLLPIVCEPHIKLHRSGRAGDTEHYFHRIYFSSVEHAEFKGKTLIGHIGKHL